MGNSRVICIQEERLFQLGGSGVIVQPENLAIEILPYVNVTPFVRIKSSSVPPPSLQAVTAATISSLGITFKFMTAPLMFYEDEGGLSGSRWIDTSNSISVKSGDTPAPLPAGRTYAGSTIANSGSGGLLLWQLANNDGSVTQTFMADLYLICRGR
jgi:hypothetical protein